MVSALSGYSDMSQLVNSCKDSSKVLGTILQLDIASHYSPFPLSEFEELPSCLLEGLTSIWYNGSIIDCEASFEGSVHHPHSGVLS